jgi:hypothetical protein
MDGRPAGIPFKRGCWLRVRISRRAHGFNRFTLCVPPFSSFHPFLSSTNFYRDCAMLDCTGKGAVQIPIERGEGYLLGCMGGNIFRLDHS